MVLFPDFPKIYTGSLDTLVEKLLRQAKKKDNNRYITPTNLDLIRQYYTDKKAKEAYKHAWLRTADGLPLVLFSKFFFGYKMKERITGVELTIRLIESITKNKLPLKIYFLGGDVNAGQKIVKRLTKIYPNFSRYFAGCSSTYFDLDKDKDKVKKEVEKIKKLSPDFLIIGIGSPKQERFLYENQRFLNYGVAVCAGQTIHILAGDEKMPPKLIERIGLTFLYRTFSKKGGVRILKRVLKDVMFLLKYSILLFLNRKKTKWQEHQKQMKKKIMKMR